MNRTLILAIAIVTLCGGTARAGCDIGGWGGGGGGGGGFTIGGGTGGGTGTDSDPEAEDPTISNLHIVDGKITCTGSCDTPKFTGHTGTR